MAVFVCDQSGAGDGGGIGPHELVLHSWRSGLSHSSLPLHIAISASPHRHRGGTGIRSEFQVSSHIRPGLSKFAIPAKAEIQLPLVVIFDVVAKTDSRPCAVSFAIHGERVTFSARPEKVTQERTPQRPRFFAHRAQKRS